MKRFNYIRVPSAPSIDVTGLNVILSVRRLVSGYAGPCLRVRRSFDNAEMDIGFDGSGDLDTAALLAFVGSGDGFVRTWYDQSGNNRHAHQNLSIFASAQPQIVFNGVVATANSRPAIRFVGQTPAIQYTFLYCGPYAFQACTSFTVFKYNQAATSNGVEDITLGIVSTTTSVNRGGKFNNATSDYAHRLQSPNVRPTNTRVASWTNTAAAARLNNVALNTGALGNFNSNSTGIEVGMNLTSIYFANTLSGSPGSGTKHFCIGADHNYEVGRRHFVGDISEVLIGGVMANATIVNDLCASQVSYFNIV